MKTMTRVSTKQKVLVSVGVVAILGVGFWMLNSLSQGHGLVPSFLKRTAVQSGTVGFQTMPKPKAPIKANTNLPKSNTPVNAPIRTTK